MIAMRTGRQEQKDHCEEVQSLLKTYTQGILLVGTDRGDFKKVTTGLGVKD